MMVPQMSIWLLSYRGTIAAVGYRFRITDYSSPLPPVLSVVSASSTFLTG